MTDPFIDPSKLGTGSYFKPADHVNDLVILFEPKSFEGNVPNTYNGVQTFRDEVTANLYVFANSEQLSTKSPTVLKDVKVVHGGLTRKLAQAMGSVVPGKVEKVTTKKGNTAWSLESATVDLTPVKEFYVAHRAEVEANLASAPAFD